MFAHVQFSFSFKYSNIHIVHIDIFVRLFVYDMSIGNVVKLLFDEDTSALLGFVQNAEIVQLIGRVGRKN